MQLTTVGKEVWSGAKQAQRLAEAGAIPFGTEACRPCSPSAGDPTVQERLRKLKLAQSLHDREADWDEIQELVGISRATYYCWDKALRQGGAQWLETQAQKA